MRDEASGAMGAVDDLVAELHAALAAAEARTEALVSENAALVSEKEKQSKQLERFRRQLSAILRKVFRKTSERTDSAQLWMRFESLLTDAQRALLEERAKREAKEPTPRKRREEKPRGAAAHPAVKRRRKTVEPSEKDRRCGECSGEMRRIGEDVSSTLVWMPGHFVLLEVARGKWACRCGLGTVVTEPAPRSVIPGSIASPSLLGHLAVSKYADHLPLYRQAKMLTRAGVALSTSTLSDWMHQVAQMLTPLRDALAANIVSGDIVAIDDTRLEMQRNSKKLAKKRCFLWGYRSPSGETVFDFSLSRAGTEPQRFLDGMRGHVQNDAYSAHDALFVPDKGRIRVGCWAHARRRFVHAMESDPERASLAVALIGQLYDVEREARKGGLDAAARAKRRRERCPEVLSMLHDLLEHWAPEVLPASALGDAIGYTLAQWETLIRYVDEGRLEIDNNAIERSIRGIALGRRNHLFVGSEQGGHDAAIFYSLIESCRSADVEPMAYLTDVIERIAATPASRVAELLPARWKAARDAQQAAYAG